MKEKKPSRQSRDKSIYKKKYLIQIQNTVDEEMIRLIESNSSNKFQNILKTLTDIRFIKKTSLKKNIMKKLNNLYIKEMC